MVSWPWYMKGWIWISQAMLPNVTWLTWYYWMFFNLNHPCFQGRMQKKARKLIKVKKKFLQVQVWKNWLYTEGILWILNKLSRVSCLEYNCPQIYVAVMSYIHSPHKIISMMGKTGQDARQKQKPCRKVFIHIGSKSASNKLKNV